MERMEQGDIKQQCRNTVTSVVYSSVYLSSLCMNQQAIPSVMLLTSPGVKRGVVCVQMFRDIFGNILTGAFTVGQG